LGRHPKPHTHTTHNNNNYGAVLRSHTHTPHPSQYITFQLLPDVQTIGEDTRITRTELGAHAGTSINLTAGSGAAMGRMTSDKLGQPFGQLVTAVAEHFESNLGQLDNDISLAP